MSRRFGVFVGSLLVLATVPSMTTAHVGHGFPGIALGRPAAGWLYVLDSGEPTMGSALLPPGLPTLVFGPLTIVAKHRCAAPSDIGLLRYEAVNELTYARHLILLREDAPGALNVTFSEPFQPKEAGRYTVEAYFACYRDGVLDGADLDARPNVWWTPLPAP